MKTTTSIYAEKAKFIYDMEYKLAELKPEDIAAGNKADINFLSEQCPYLFGSGVYKARTLRGLYEDGVDYNDKVICQSAGYFKKEQGTATDDEMPLLQTQIGEFDLVSNPVSHTLRYKYLLPDNIKARIEIFDNLGKLVYSQENISGQALSQLSVASHPAGIFHIRIVAENGFTKSINYLKN